MRQYREYGEGTRFVVDTEHHYLYGEIYRDELYLVDLQSNFEEELPPLYGKNCTPGAAHLRGKLGKFRFWAVVP